PGNHLHADAARDARELASDSTEPDDAERFAAELHSLQRFPFAAPYRPVHARDLATAGEYQRHRVFRDGGIAITLDGVHLDAEPVERRNVHVARCARAQEHDVLELAAARHDFRRQI